MNADLPECSHSQTRLATPSRAEYNAEMGEASDCQLNNQLDSWLGDGGLVITASERAARALATAFHRARQAEGLSAWPAPRILDWQSFLLKEWEDRASDGRLLLDTAQEQSIWAEIAGSDKHMATLLEGPRFRMAALAMDAHKLLCSHAPQYLRGSARGGWQQDAANFSAWLAAFEQTCQSGNLLSPARLPLELIALLESPSSEDSQSERPPLLLAGFDRILPIQRRVFDTWGSWKEAASGQAARKIYFHEASDTQAEIAACALWCKRQIDSNPEIRLLVITQDLSKRRGEIERAFHQFTGPTPTSPLFEFSLGIPLGQVALARGARLLLRWLAGPLEEHEIDWLFSTGQVAADPQESLALVTYMRGLRSRSLERPAWSLEAFLKQRSDTNPLPAQWIERITGAQRRLSAFAAKPQSPLDWAELAPPLLQAAGWPGYRPLSSAEFQALRRWQQVVDACASLGFDGRRIPWQEFLSAFNRALDQTLFVPQSLGAPIQIAGPAESAGLTADAIWFLGASENAWPASGSAHPLLPVEVQRESAMPHASPQLDWELASAITNRLLASAASLHFSCARQSEGVDTRPSRLIAQIAGTPQPLPTELLAPAAQTPLAVYFPDHSQVPCSPGNVRGGSSVLTDQSQCPFKAFATARLAAQAWKAAEAGLTPSQRGQLLHAVLHTLWGGPPEGIRTLKELQELKDPAAFTAAIVRSTLKNEIRSGIRERMPRRYLELEEQRLTRLVTEWLSFEASRADFQVLETEVKHTIELAGLIFNLRLDRIDRLNDNTLLVIDYKTGTVTPQSWELPRPDDVQLPLYAGFAVDPEEELGGLVFAKVRTGDCAFAGRVGDAKATLLPAIGAGSNLVKDSLNAEQLIDWREHIRQLALDFLAGRSEVDPRDYPNTCEYCGLETLCRIQENQALLQVDEDSDGVSATEAADE